MTPGQFGAPTISICVCTYNRADSLRCILESLVAQEPCENFIETLIVDNNSTDNTREVVDEFRVRLPIRYVLEPMLGLSHARNRALAEFRGSHILFTDDDVVLMPNWGRAFAAAIAQHADVDYFGGRVLPDWSGRKPGWVGPTPLPLIAGLLCWYDLGDQTRSYGAADIEPIGASLGLSRRLAAQIGGFDPALGCRGRTRGRGEDTEWIVRAKANGAIGVYVGSALCLHHVDERSLTLAGLFRYGVESGRAVRIIDGGDRRFSAVRLVDYALRGLWQGMRGRGDRLRQCVINMGIECGSATVSREAARHLRAANSLISARDK